jgi:hypothetical protein
LYLIDSLDEESTRGTPENACWTFVAGKIAVPSADYNLSVSSQEAAVRGASQHLLDSETNVGISLRDEFSGLNFGIATTTSPSQLKQRTESYFHCMMNMTNGRCAFRTKSGCTGLGSIRVRRGDKLVLFRDGTALMVLRSVGREGCYRVVGEAWANDTRANGLYNQILRSYSQAVDGGNVEGIGKIEEIELE